MNFIPVITHAFAILIGWLLVSFACIPDPVPNQIAGNSTDKGLAIIRPSRSDRHATPASLLSAQANTEMDPYIRFQLKRRILEDWSTTDPAGLLRHLENRPWLSLVEQPVDEDDPMPWLSHQQFTNAAHKAFQTLARTRPADLLSYAKREGCEVAISELYRHGDPRLVLDLLLTLPPDYFSSDVFGDVVGELFARGCELDLTFHERLNAIEDPELKLGVFDAVAGTLLANERESALFAWLAKQDDPRTHERHLGAVASQIVKTRSDVRILGQLPESLRPKAVRLTLEYLASGSAGWAPDENHQRKSLTTLRKSGWLDGNIDLASNVITASYYPPEPNRRPPPTAATWKPWALALPEIPMWDPLRHTAIRRWALEDPAQWNAIADLPTKDLRHVAYTAVLHTLDLERDRDRIPWILHQITDPVLRASALDAITKRVENDPAAADLDPFHPLEAR